MVRLCDGSVPFTLQLVPTGGSPPAYLRRCNCSVPPICRTVIFNSHPDRCSSSMAHFEDCKFFLRGACVNGERPFYAKRRRVFISNRDGRDGSLGP